MNTERVSIFDIPLLVDSICSSLSSRQIAVCRRVCKTWDVAFATNEWRTIWLYKHLMSSPYDELTADEIKQLRSYSQWIQKLGISLFDTVLNDSLCLNLQSLKVFCDRPAPKNSTMDESSLALLWRNRGLKNFVFDLHDSYVLRHVLPNIPRLTFLQNLEIRIDHGWTSDLAILLDVLQCLPPSLKELKLYTVSHWKWDNFANISMTPPRTWKLSALRGFSFYVRNNRYGPRFLMPFLRSCHQLEHLRLPVMPSDCTEELMRSLAAASPRLERLDLNAQGPGTAESGTECLYFSYLRQELKHLSIEVHTDTENAVLPTVLSYSAATLQTLHLKKAAWLRSLDVALIVRTCPGLCVLHIEAFCDPAGRPTPSTTLEDLVEAPWACTRLEKFDLAVTDVRNPTLVTDVDGKREQLAHLVLRLNQQFQDLEHFLPYLAHVFWKQNFINLPSHAILRERGWRMTEGELRQLALGWKGYSNNPWAK